MEAQPVGSGFEVADQVSGSAIRRIRKERGWSQKHLGSIIGVGQPDISRMERGKDKIGRQSLERIVSAFGVDYSHLLFQAVPQPPTRNELLTELRDSLLTASENLFNAAKLVNLLVDQEVKNVPQKSTHFTR